MSYFLMIICTIVACGMSSTVCVDNARQLSHNFTLSRSEDVARKRNESRENPIPEHVCARLTSLCEYPDPKSNSWEKNTVVADSSESSKEVFENFLRLGENPPPPLPTEKELAELKARLEAARAATLRNAVHVTDKTLRKRIGEIMRSAKGNKKLLAKELNSTRKAVLDSLRKDKKLTTYLYASPSLSILSTETCRHFYKIFKINYSSY